MSRARRRKLASAWDEGYYDGKNDADAWEYNPERYDIVDGQWDNVLAAREAYLDGYVAGYAWARDMVREMGADVANPYTLEGPE